jgi:hypothetical protein
LLLFVFPAIASKLGGTHQELGGIGIANNLSATEKFAIGCFHILSTPLC